MPDFEKSVLAARPPAGTVRIVWFEQSHFMFATSAGKRTHVDPFLSRKVKPENHIHPEPLVPPERAPADLVFVTHDHRDHTDPHTLIPMAEANPSCVFYGPQESIERCKAGGIDPSRLVAVTPGDRVQADGAAAEVVYAEDTSDGDGEGTPHQGYVFEIDGVSIYMVGDTRRDPDAYADKIRTVQGRAPDVMIVPINEGYNNPGPAGASRLVEMVDPGLIVPCHFGCFTHNTIDPALFVDALPERYSRRVRVMARGGVLDVSG